MNVTGIVMSGDFGLELSYFLISTRLLELRLHLEMKPNEIMISYKPRARQTLQCAETLVQGYCNSFHEEK